MDTLEIKTQEITDSNFSLLNVWLHDKIFENGKSGGYTGKGYRLTWICYPEDIKTRLFVAKDNDKDVIRTLIDDFRMENAPTFVNLYQIASKKIVDRMILLIDLYILKCVTAISSKNR